MLLPESVVYLFVTVSSASAGLPYCRFPGDWGLFALSGSISYNVWAGQADRYCGRYRDTFGRAGLPLLVESGAEPDVGRSQEM